MGVAAVCLLLMLIVAAAWWAYNRWQEAREAEAQREQSAALFILQARSQVRAKPPTMTPESANSLQPILSEGSPGGPELRRTERASR
jgi:hypothetical protein